MGFSLLKWWSGTSAHEAARQALAAAQHAAEAAAAAKAAAASAAAAAAKIKMLCFVVGGCAVVGTGVGCVCLVVSTAAYVRKTNAETDGRSR